MSENCKTTTNPSCDIDDDCSPLLLKGENTVSLPPQELSFKDRILRALTVRDRESTTYLVICLVAITQGIVGLSDLAMNYLYKDDLHMSPAQVSLAGSLTGIPWIIKPLWGFTSDVFPLFGYRRKSYLFIFGCVGVAGWFLMGEYATTMLAAILILALIQVANAFCNVIGEALVVEESQRHQHTRTDREIQEEAAKNVSLFFGIKNVGVVVTAYTGGLLLEYFTKKTIFLTTAAFPLMLCFAAIILKEPRVVEREAHQRLPEIEHQHENEHHEEDEESRNPISAREHFNQLTTFLGRPEIGAPVLFIFAFMLIPATNDAMFFFYTNELGFKPEFMGRLRLILGIANLMGIYLYNNYLKHVPFKKIFAVSVLICIFCGCTQIMLVTRTNIYFGIPDKMFTLTSGFINQALAEINAMPILVLACRLCPKNIEGSMYAFLMSTMNLGSLISLQVGGLMTSWLGITQRNFDNLWLFILIANVSMAFFLPVLWYIPIKGDPQEEEEEEEEKSENEDNDSQKGEEDGEECKENDESAGHLGTSKTSSKYGIWDEEISEDGSEDSGLLSTTTDGSKTSSSD